jgi:FKBP-type peptidyl-prolyl cis-trans isomerase
MKINKYLVEKDADAIRGYINRHGWKMQESKAGLWYEITNTGTGKKAETGKTATLEYQVRLLNGTPCYSSDSLGNKTFTIGKGGVEPGLELGILMLREGDKARFIMPPHLAHGLVGDQNKIPARATIVYEVHLLKISDPQ